MIVRIVRNSASKEFPAQHFVECEGFSVRPLEDVEDTDFRGDEFIFEVRRGTALEHRTFIVSSELEEEVFIMNNEGRTIERFNYRVN